MESFVREHIKDFIARLGYEYCEIETIEVVLNDAIREFTITGQNEYYFLATDPAVDAIEIFADNNYIIVDTMFRATKYWRIKELTGTITITIPAGKNQILEFLRVIPQQQ
jgi:hypothetical protein